MRPLILWLFVFCAAACGTVGPSGTPCEIGRSQTCACAGGGTGAQECSPAGVYSACVCATPDAEGDVAADIAVADATPADATADSLSMDAGGDVAVADSGSDASVCDADVPPRGDPSNCGACGVTCPTPPNTAGASCLFGRCAFESCRTGFADCDSDSANGCEVSTSDDPRNCSACGRACRSDIPFCVAGACTYCRSGYTRCAGTACVNLLADQANCGGCGVACSSRCCNGRCASVLTDSSNCGACGRACEMGTRCVTGACVPL